MSLIRRIIDDEIKFGDKVRVISNSTSHNYEINREYEVTNINNNQFQLCQGGYWAIRNDLIKVIKF
jgi:hypothetical protein